MAAAGGTLTERRRRPPVLLVGSFLSRRVGTRTVAEELAERLAGAGWPVTTTSDAPSRLGRLLDVARTVFFGGPWAVAQVDVYSGPAFAWAYLAGRGLARRRVPHVLTLHGGQLPELAARWPRAVGRLLAGAAAVTAPSAYLQEAMRPHRADVTVLPNPLDLAAYPFALRERPRPRLVWLRAFHRVYRPELAVEVLARIADGHPAATLTMIGPDKGDGSLAAVRRRAAELGVGERLELVGAVAKAEVPRWLARGDLFLNTSDVDNAPVTVTEAQACGLAVVTTDAGGVRRLVADGRDALVVPRGDAAAMAREVARILAEPDLAAGLSAQGRRRAEERDWSRILPLWEELLEICAGGGKTS